MKLLESATLLAALTIERPDGTTTLNFVPLLAIAAGAFSIWLGYKSYQTVQQKHRSDLLIEHQGSKFKGKGTGAGFAFVAFGTALAIAGIIFTFK